MTMNDFRNDDNTIDVKEYVVAASSYLSNIKANPVVTAQSLIPRFRGEIMSLDEKLDGELKTLSDINKIHFEIERALTIDNAPKAKKGWLGFRYGIARHVPPMRGSDASLSELLLLQSSNITKACESLSGHTEDYESLADGLQRFEENLYERTEMLAERKDDLQERMDTTQDVLDKHVIAKKENPKEKERNTYLMHKNKLTRLLADMRQEHQLANQQYVLAMEQTEAVSDMINYMKAQGGVCKAIRVYGETTADYLRETAAIHDTAESMHKSTADVIERITLAGQAVDRLGEMRHMMQTLTIEKAKEYIGSGEGSGHRKLLEAPTREAQELSKMMKKMHDERLTRRYELE
jgi:hypothetical protein